MGRFGWIDAAVEKGGLDTWVWYCTAFLHAGWVGGLGDTHAGLID